MTITGLYSPFTLRSCGRPGDGVPRVGGHARRRRDPRSIPALDHHQAGGRRERQLRCAPAPTTMTEFEFHISPVASSSRPQTGVGYRGHEIENASCPVRSSVTLTGLAIAWAQSGIRPSRQRRIS